MCTLIVDLNCKGLLEDCVCKDAVTVLLSNLMTKLTIPLVPFMNAKLADLKDQMFSFTHTRKRNSSFVYSCWCLSWYDCFSHEFTCEWTHRHTHAHTDTHRHTRTHRHNWIIVVVLSCMDFWIKKMKSVVVYLSFISRTPERTFM